MHPTLRTLTVAASILFLAASPTWSQTKSSSRKASEEKPEATPKPKSSSSSSRTSKRTSTDDSGGLRSGEESTGSSSKLRKFTPETPSEPTPTAGESEPPPGSSKRQQKAAPDEPATTDTAPAETAAATPKPTPSPTATPAPTKATDPTAALSATPVPKSQYAPSATLQPEELVGFENQPPRVQALIRDALELAGRNLTYTFGSDDPARGGMDCSGAVSHLLKKHGFTDVPRDASGQYTWTRKANEFYAVVSKSPESFEFKDLQPGDLLFWSGTYDARRDPPVTHTMIYLGQQKGRGKVMWGSSDGRSYNGQARNGVSVFDFHMPRSKASGDRPQADFLGYARIPGLREPSAQVVAQAPDSPAPATAETEKAPEPEKAAELKESAEKQRFASPSPKRSESSEKKRSQRKSRE